MARETKVGLLAGLTFIICFAIILANRGGRDLVPSQVSSLFKDGLGGGEYSRPLSNASPTQRDRQNYETEREFEAAPVRLGPGALPQSEPIRAEHAPRNASSRGRQRDEEGRAPDQAKTAFRGRFASGPVLAVPSSDTASRVAQLEQKLEQLSRNIRSNQPALDGTAVATDVPGQQRAVPVRIPVRASVPPTHRKIVAGDTLSKIAAEHYGSKSRRFIDAIFDANRSILARPDEIKVGMDLLLPVLADTAPRNRPNRASESAAKRSSVTERPKQSYLLYQIEKNDRYVTIADEQLGDRSRWKEIYELNRNLFPDAGSIRAGVLIKLPTSGTADGRR